MKLNLEKNNMIKYYVVQKSNGKFAPRLKRVMGNTEFGHCWFHEPYEFDTLEEAKGALLREKREDEEYRLSLAEKVVFELN